MRPRIGVVGLNHGYSLARSAASCNAVQLAALCARNPDHHREQAEHLGVPLFGSLDSMLSERDLDGVVIAAPTHQLTAITQRCLSRDISVLVEKPVGVSVAEVLELESAAARSRARVVVGYYRRLARQVGALKTLLAAGTIGDVVGVSCKWVIRKAPDYYKGWKASRAQGGGCLTINVIHDLDLLQHLLGPIETVSAMQSREAHHDDLEHLVVLNLRFRGGPLGTVIFSDQSPSPYSYDTTVAAVSKFPQYPVDSHHFFGTAGSLAFPSFTLHSSRSNSSSWYDVLVTSKVSDSNQLTDDPITRELEHFAEVIRGRSEPCATIDDAVRNLLVVEAIRRALETSGTEPVRERSSGT